MLREALGEEMMKRATDSYSTVLRPWCLTGLLALAVAGLLGTQLHRTMAHHLQSNGSVERFHRQLKFALRARLSGPNWIKELPWVLLGIRTTPKEDLGCSTAEMVYATPLVVPGDFVTS